MTHTVLQSSPMTPEEFARSDATHARAVGDDEWFKEARIIERKVNAVGEFPVQFDDGGFGAVLLAAVGDTIELYRPLREYPPELWFTRAHHNESAFYSLSAWSLPPGLLHGPLTDEQRDDRLADREHGEDWAARTWIKYVPAP